MQDLTAKRTLVKSPPELWSELSEVERLARHLGAFGEIKITRLELERTVAWEGEGASGTVSIEPSGWGTKVTLTATIEGEEAAPLPEPIAEVPDETSSTGTELPEPRSEAAFEPLEPVAEPVAMQPRRRRLLGWLFGREARADMPNPAAEHPVWVSGAAAPADEAPVEEPVTDEPAPLIAEEPTRPPAEQPSAEEPLADPVAEESAEDPPLNRDGAQAALEGALEALGSAHHRPFSRG
ncbi:MAG: hypothetical protein QOD71_2162 [Thermoleophilaceae bacterium]|jgi:hypothetical protein|nr:hypothetical protein [Thermoleophilaceae bacterium]